MTENEIREFLISMNQNPDTPTAQAFIKENTVAEKTDFELAEEVGCSPSTVRHFRDKVERERKGPDPAMTESEKSLHDEMEGIVNGSR